MVRCTKVHTYFQFLTQGFAHEPLFLQCTGCPAETLEPLPTSGSNRRYFRLEGGGRSLVGVVGNSLEENRAFIALDRHFRGKGLPVPEVLAVSEDGYCYLQEDLGGRSLFDLVSEGRERGEYSAQEVELLKQAIAVLPRFQFLGAEGLPWSVCYPQEAFDSNRVDWDLSYFKYCFLKASGLEYNDLALQEDFNKLKATLLEEAGGNTFLYRDFQARNILVSGGKPWFIDFQGGFRGPIYYDVASFIYQARSRFPEAVKAQLLEAYLQALQSFQAIDGEVFRARLRPFVLFRLLQVLGAYGFRGYFERKPHFLSSIPGALDTLRELLQTPFSEYPYLDSLLRKLSEKPAPAPAEGPLTVTVYSFSYRRGLPPDESGNGGGYVFDCRAIHNPGRYEQYKQLNGTDTPVIRFLEEDGEVQGFLESVFALVDTHVERYQARGFSHLQVSFGCTGGRHRSVYCAEHLAAHLAAKYGIRVVLRHREQGIEKVL